MLAAMPARILEEWRAYERVEPFGQWRADLRASIISATIANHTQALRNVWTKRSHQTRYKYKPKDFMPQFERKKDPTQKQLFEKVKAINAMLGGKVLDRIKHGV